MRKSLATVVLGLLAVSPDPDPARGADWAPAKGPLMTKWAKDVSPDSVLPEYPRPQLVRKDWLNLNGLWQMAIGQDAKESAPTGKELGGTILVPFPVESALSGVMKPAERLWYRRTFRVPEGWKEKRALLHFGAVDWEAEVFVNGKSLGTHRGGYDGFSFDVTDALKPGGGDQELIVRVYDPTDQSTQPRGKQVNKPGGIFYTPTTGIWQTVWLEPVPRYYLKGLKVEPDLAAGKVRVTAESGDLNTRSRPFPIAVKVMDGETTVARGSGVEGQPLELAIPDAKPWSPDSPTLYSLEVRLGGDNEDADQVGSYFGMRSIAVGPDEKGTTRLLLNGKPLFQVGPLDQGYWPDGLYTAPTDAALKYDVEVTKQLGFNMTRKHVKVEPDRWYYWCDRLGLIVWQDMPAGDKGISPDDDDLKRSPESAEIYRNELKAMIDGLRNHPSIVMWVVFNEGWGQFDTAKVTEWTKAYDPSRLVDCASGWTDRAGVGDVHDMHKYPGPGSFHPEPKRAAVLGEFGGLGLALPGHTWSKESWGYRGTAGAEDLTVKYQRLLQKSYALKDDPGLSAVVYTQLTDVETECNGLLTYDREVIKVDPSRTRAANLGETVDLPTDVEVVPTSRDQPAKWRMTISAPAAGWELPGFDDSSWKEAPGGFGTEETPGSSVGTKWSGPDVWIRRGFDLGKANHDKLALVVHHDEDAEIYLNGVVAAKLKGHVSDYEEAMIAPEALATLKPTGNVMAVHCHQTVGGQFIDVGLTERKPAAK